MDRKARAVSEIIRKYANPSTSTQTSKSMSSSSSGGDRERDREEYSDRDRDTPRNKPLTESDIHRVLASISDNEAYLAFNVHPVRRAIEILKSHFDPKVGRVW